MTEIERAIEWFGYRQHMGFSDHCEKMELIALRAIREKQERDLGCEFCNADYAVMSGSRMSDDGMHKGCAAIYCPNCGRRLEAHV